MNETLKKLQQQMEQATSPDADQADLDPQTAPLREAWTMLGRLLETAVPMEEPAWQRWKRPLRRRRRWVPAAAMTVAASLLICAAAVWLWQSSRSRVLPGPVSPEMARSIIVPPAPQQAPKAIVKSLVQPHATPSPDALKWDDSLDEQLAVAGQQVIRLQQGWSSQAMGGAATLYQWEQVRADVTGDKL